MFWNGQGLLRHLGPRSEWDYIGRLDALQYMFVMGGWDLVLELVVDLGLELVLEFRRAGAGTAGFGSRLGDCFSLPRRCSPLTVLCILGMGLVLVLACHYWEPVRSVLMDWSWFVFRFFFCCFTWFGTVSTIKEV